MRVGAIVTAHSMEVVPKINQLISRTTLWSPAILLWVLYTKGKIIVLESSLHPHIHCDIIHNSQDMETPGVLADRERIKKTGDAHSHIHRHAGILFTHEREENPATGDKIEGP